MRVPPNVSAAAYAQALAEFAQAIGGEWVFTSDADLDLYRDAFSPFLNEPEERIASGALAPLSTEQVQQIVRIANKYRIPLYPISTGRNLGYGGSAPAYSGSVVLDLKRMNRILEVAPDEMLARAQTGVTTQALNNAAAAHGLFYPPDPGSQTVSTIGGNVATCAGGLRGLKYGVTRNYVLGLTVALATGEIIRTGGRLWKDVAGYDLTRLITGSEGTLGVITEVTVALLPDPSTSRTGLAYFDTLAQAGRAVAGILAAGVIPATLEFLDRKCMDAVEQYAHLGLHSDAGALLLFGDDGDEVAVARSFERIAAACADSGAITVQTAGDATESEALLTARRCTLPALSRLGSLTILEDASVPRPRLAEMVARIDAIAAQHQVTMATFGHAGDGNLHPTCVLESAEDTEGIARAERAFADVFGTAIELGGTITGEHGVGAAKLPYLGQRLGTEQMALLRRIKTAFDPAGILNPGKLGS